MSAGPLVDLRDTADIDRIEPADVPEGETPAEDGEEAEPPLGWGWRIGAGVRVAALATSPHLSDYTGLQQAAGGLATPQIRAMATVGGNLLQRNRCWYYRNPDFVCFQRGGDTCPARNGDHLYHACFDHGPCIAPHPSTLAVALVAYDATVEIEGGDTRPLADLYGDGSDPTRDHLLEPTQALRAVLLPPTGQERSTWFRVASRERAEWPLVEGVARLRVEQDIVTEARVVLGGVARIPLRCREAETALLGHPLTDEHLARAAEAATRGANPPAMTRYKLPLVSGCVTTMLERLRDAV